MMKKKQITKRLLALLCSLVLLAVFCMPFTAVAEEAVLLDWDELDTDLDYYTRFKDQKLTLNVYNWGEYISTGEDESLNVNKEFERLTGIKVNYTTFASNEDLYAKMKSGGANYDIIIPSDYMIGKMIEENMLQKLDFEQIPNFRFISEDNRNMEYDPTNEYSVPYTWGTVGIIYNTTMVDEEVNSWDILWDEKYADNILMFRNSRDAFGIALKKLGQSFNTTDEQVLKEAAEELKKQKFLVQSYVMDEIFDKMAGGEAALAPYYAGDAITMIDDNPDLDFAVPQEGTNKFVDAICIPSTSKNQEIAQMYINYLCETQVALANIEYICYSSPHTGALEELDEETRDNPIIYPPQEIIEKSETFKNLPPETNQLIDDLWTEVMIASTSSSQWIVPLFMLAGVIFSITLTVVRTVRKNRNVYEKKRDL